MTCDLLFECARLWVFGHYIMQCLHTNVDDATELVLDDTETEHRIAIINRPVCDGFMEQ